MPSWCHLRSWRAAASWARRRHLRMLVNGSDAGHVLRDIDRVFPCPTPEGIPSRSDCRASTCRGSLGASERRTVLHHCRWRDDSRGGGGLSRTGATGGVVILLHAQDLWGMGRQHLPSVSGTPSILNGATTDTTRSGRGGKCCALSGSDARFAKL